MIKLTLYKNFDLSQPVSFIGWTLTGVKQALRAWMDANNGVDSKADQVDGLTVFDDEADDGDAEVHKGVTLYWIECYEQWELDSHDDELGEEHFTDWPKARDAFIGLAMMQGEMEGR